MEIFYSEDLTGQSRQIQLSAEESRHLRKALRKKAGDQIRITNGMGLVAEAVIRQERSKSTVCEIQAIRLLPPAPEKNIHLALSTIRPNRQDWAVEKLTELGIGTISFFRSQFTSMRSFKAGHLKKIAISAIKQSGQAYLPQINPPLPFGEWIQSLPEGSDQLRLIAHLSKEAPRTLEAHLQKPKLTIPSIIVAIGPEGGFAEQEVTMACANGFQIITLDEHVLRSETAAVVAAALAKSVIRKR